MLRGDYSCKTHFLSNFGPEVLALGAFNMKRFFEISLTLLQQECIPGWLGTPHEWLMLPAALAQEPRSERGKRTVSRIRSCLDSAY